MLVDEAPPRLGMRSLDRGFFRTKALARHGQHQDQP
jgi:hypothetical protein